MLRASPPRAVPDIVTFDNSDSITTGGLLFGEYVSVPVLNMGAEPISDVKVAIRTLKRGKRFFEVFPYL